MVEMWVLNLVAMLVVDWVFQTVAWTGVKMVVEWAEQWSDQTADDLVLQKAGQSAGYLAE